jgi:hypothetical protein
VAHQHQDDDSKENNQINMKIEIMKFHSLRAGQAWQDLRMSVYALLDSNNSSRAVGLCDVHA